MKSSDLHPFLHDYEIERCKNISSTTVYSEKEVFECFTAFNKSYDDTIRHLEYAQIFHISPTEPILLTEEWLLRFGFKKINNSMFRNCNWTAQGCWNYSTLEKGFKICIEGSFSRNIYYVHQLQNLYFALTCNELNIIKQND